MKNNPISGRFEDIIRLCDVSKIMKILEIKENDEDSRIETDKPYPLYKDLFGVHIEFGSISFVKVTTGEALETLDSLTIIRLDRHGKIILVPKNNFEGLYNIAKKYGLTIPDRNSVEGYIMNGELIRIDNHEHDSVIVKYKDRPENIYYTYKLFFTKIGENLHMVIEKSI